MCTHRSVSFVSNPISSGIDPSRSLLNKFLWSAARREKEIKRACGEEERDRERTGGERRW